MDSEIVELDSGPERLHLVTQIPGAAPGTVFDRWIDPEQIVRWWPIKADIDPRPGGAYHFTWPVIGWNLRGEFIAVDPSQALSFTWRWDHDPVDKPTTTVDVSFESHAGGTRLTLMHGPYPVTPQGGAWRQEHREGWLYFLGKLRALESGS